jgi:hypothetical protein
MERHQAQAEEQRSQLEAEYLARQSMAEGSPTPVEADPTIEQRIRKQYETRLKEAATKIQQAYEQHLQEKLVEARFAGPAGVRPAPSGGDRPLPRRSPGPHPSLRQSLPRCPGARDLASRKPSGQPRDDRPE